ncbi:MAG: phosphate signaling complex protein PhoU [Actinomycetota bacterium]|nr:phosphate signaling complex protein PhoU [Actinomycetota bacterium]MDA3016154.1 phosphate signaling complex protein PhoU [Actinomycetota bacterium]MDA3028388.1 phosphate signaling complex protein PhoU [Actinomycetota bacterium]
MAELRADFHRDLEEIRSLVARLGAFVTELIPRVTGVLLDQDIEGAEYVLLGDAEVDARALDIEERSLRLLALQSPVAGDLREVASALKISADMERSADLCCNVCKAARRIYGHELDPKLRGIIQKLSDQATKEYREALDAYVNGDAVKAAALPDIDGYLDDVHRQFLQQILESHASGTIDLQVAVQLALVARFYERLGDHAVNLGNKVRYIATGWMPEQEALTRLRERDEQSDRDSGE